MWSKTLIYISIVFLMLSCNNINSRKRNIINHDTTITNIEQKSQGREVFETQLNTEKASSVDTINHQQEKKNTEIGFKSQAIKLSNKANKLFSYVGGEPFSKTEYIIVR